MRTATDAPAPSRIGGGLRTAILLAGRVGRSPLADHVGRSILDLPVGRGRTLLQVWSEQFHRLAADHRLSSLRVRIAAGADDQVPRLPPPAENQRVSFEVVRDAAEYRGTAGVVRDLTEGLSDSELVLVAAAHQIQCEPLASAIDDLPAGREGVSLVPCGTSDLAGIFLLRRARLVHVPEIGFVDLKEQALPAAPDSEPLVVTRRARGATLPVRTLEEYVRALRALHVPHGAAEAEPEPSEAFAEEWRARFSIVEEGATAAPSAVLLDSVVLAGGRVEAGAVVARSVVCPGAVVRRGEVVVGKVFVG